MGVNSIFKKLVYKVLEKIKSELYFKWHNRMRGTPLKETKISTATTTRTKGIQLKSAELYRTS